MSAIVRISDVNSGGGVVTSTPQSNFHTNGLLVAVVGAKGTGHPPCQDETIHCSGVWETQTTQTTFHVSGKLAIMVGDVDTCDHSRVNGSENFFI